jgi:hypothetical protein
LVKSGKVDEHDAVGEERVEEGADQGQHAIAEVVVGEPDEVVALRAATYRNDSVSRRVAAERREPAAKSERD